MYGDISIDPAHLPVHIGIIMDGNGRWAKQRHRPRLYGHRAGANNVRPIVEIAAELNIQYLTFMHFLLKTGTDPGKKYPDY